MASPELLLSQPEFKEAYTLIPQGPEDDMPGGLLLCV